MFHSTDNVIVHVTMKQPDPYSLHGSKDSREEIANVFVVIADMFLFVNKGIKKNVCVKKNFLCRHPLPKIYLLIDELGDFETKAKFA